MRTATHIIRAVEKLIKKYDTRDPYELCKLLGIKIHYYDLQKKLKGFFYYQSRQKNIVIDSNVNEVWNGFSLPMNSVMPYFIQKIAMMRGFQEMEVFMAALLRRTRQTSLPPSFF
mgnify:CR=1 FL=1